jgi:hypothetical protein
MPKRVYTDEIAEEICSRLAKGESLNSICNDEHMPAESTVRLWALEDAHGFTAKYARARELGYLRLADELVDISDDGRNDWMTIRRGKDKVEVVNREAVERSKLRVETRKWILAKMLPKVYGDKVTNEITGSLKVDGAVDRPPAETREEWLERRKRELAASTAVGSAAGTANGRHHS